MVDNALIGTSEFDIFSLNPATCAENWRTHEDYPPALLPANRGAAYLDGMLFRGTQDGRVLAYDFKTGKRIWETTIADPKLGEVGVVGADRLGRPRLRRQRGRGLQGREGPHVRARREDWQDRLGVLSGSQSRGRHGSRTAGRDAARRVDLEKCARHPHQRRRDLDVLHARHGNRAALCPRRQSGARLRDRRARGRQFLFRLGRRARRQNRKLQESFPDCAEGLARLGRLQSAHPDSNDGRQTADGGRAERWVPLRLRSRQQQPALPRAGDPGRGCRRDFLARQGRPFLPGLGGGRGMEQPGLRSAARTSSSSARSTGATR